MKKLKVAVQFFGHLRTFEHCFPSVKKNLLDLYDCDVFMHTWSENTHNNHEWSSDINNHEAIKKIDNSIENTIKKLYKPKKLKIQEPINFDLPNKKLFHSEFFENKTRFISASSMKSMLYSKSQVNILRNKYEVENKLKYDYVIMIRPDIQLLSSFDISNMAKIIELSNLNAKFSAFSNPCSFHLKNEITGEFPFIGDLCSDILYFSTPSIMNKITISLDKIDFNLVEMWNPESLYNKQLLDNGIACIYIHFILKKDFYIIRPGDVNTIRTPKRKHFISIHLKLKKKLLDIKILSLLKINIISFNFNILNIFNLKFNIGNTIDNK